ncbi:MAG: hypothetical protein ABI833_17950 [Acidobacteriota bacterium]
MRARLNNRIERLETRQQSAEQELFRVVVTWPVGDRLDESDLQPDAMRRRFADGGRVFEW